MEFMKTQEEQHKNLSCPFDGCSKVLTSYPGLKYHMKRHHEQHDEFICEKCQRSFKSANGLRYHCSKGKCEEGYRRTDSTCSMSDEDVPEYGVADVKEEKRTEVFVGREQRKIPPALDLTLPRSNLNELSTLVSTGMERLTEFAIFATSPQSPLMQQAPIKPWEITRRPFFETMDIKQEDNQTAETTYNTTCIKMEDNRSPQSSTDKNGNYCADSEDAMVTSTSQLHQRTDGVWSHQWPKPVWHCFIAGTKLCIGFIQWETVESIALQESIQQKAAGISGQNFRRYNELRLMEMRKFAKLDNICNSLVHLYFTSDDKSQLDMCAECLIDHPFFVKGKGWCSNDPILTERHYGIPCSILQINDVCLPPSYGESNSNENNTNYDKFTPMDRSAVYTLSTMAQQKASPKKSRNSSPTKKRQLKLDQPKPKRPMNAFMLFAKDHREEYTQKFPGKDNRAISVLLGDEWQKMAIGSRHVYAEKAKQMADQQKKMHPDCWKRKK